MASPIPIQNIYYLLIYAWNQLAEGELVDVSGIDSTELVDLYGSVLLSGLRHVTRRGLDQTYLLVSEDMAGIRGRVNMGETARRLLIHHGRAHCEFDELRVDNLQNQILKSTLRSILRAENLDSGLRSELKQMDRALRDVSTIRLTAPIFRRVQLHRNNRFYRFLLNVCELVFQSSLAAEDSGQYRFRDFVRDQRRMATLFERFVFNFLRMECPWLSVKRDEIRWQAESSADPELRYLPTMRTDVSVRSSSKTLIIDAKFYQKTHQEYYGRERVHSSNLYQIFAYLKNLEGVSGPDASADGMLLYPAVNQNLRLAYTIGGHNIQICTLDLAQDWATIRSELLDLIKADPSLRDVSATGGKLVA